MTSLSQDQMLLGVYTRLLSEKMVYLNITYIANKLYEDVQPRGAWIRLIKGAFWWMDQ